jgi:hypothetical protein
MDIPLTKEDINKITQTLSEKRFEDFKIHPHYFREKFSRVTTSIPRHNIELDELKIIFQNKQDIKRGFKRKTQKGYIYTLCYDESTNVFVKIGYIFDEQPPKIFLAMRVFRNLERAIKRRYGIIIN